MKRSLVIVAVASVFSEIATGGIAAEIAIEAEAFQAQRLAEVREWQSVSMTPPPPDVTGTAPPPRTTPSGGRYLHLLPDTRRTHADPLVVGESFSNEPGVVGVLDYEVDFPQAGRYYVWVRAYSTGSEDNGIHVGLNGEWPESGRRMQWCEGKHQWWWESKQRTAEQHCGVPHAIYLDVPRAGKHTVSFSMREDGFRFDKFLITTNRDRARPKGVGP